ncbi:hypothetical protein [Actinacidiphila acididurans]|uniref:Uncharacterized protein n=1 Tax=Actinacidiphila acididurans TaxID=2784346 RepID=A0ABS2U3H1_9ACTN|nr:hypothetical protein [Actinacidiphila acididurans]MBM9510141.1 hypothetical protein [Actinacidiphila acididurans]
MRLKHAARVFAVAAATAAATLSLSPSTTAVASSNLILWTDTAGIQHVYAPAGSLCYTVGTPAGKELYNQTVDFKISLYAAANCPTPPGPFSVIPPGSHATNVYFTSFLVSPR